MKVKDTEEIRNRIKEYQEAAFRTLELSKYAPGYAKYDWEFEAYIPHDEWDNYDEDTDTWKDPEPDGLDDAGKKAWWLDEYLDMRNSELWEYEHCDEEADEMFGDMFEENDEPDYGEEFEEESEEDKQAEAKYDTESREMLLQSVERYDDHWYDADPYVRNVYPTGWWGQSFCIGDGDAECLEAFSYNSPAQDKNNPALFVPRLCYNSVPQFELTDLYDPRTGETLVSVSPKEILETKKYIERAHGNVLAIGFGLGYFAYMAARKEEVASVTVVEDNEELVAYMQEFVIPQMECSDKIKILVVDKGSFLLSVKEGEYDYCFVNFGVNSAESYIKWMCTAGFIPGLETDVYNEDWYLYKITMLAVKEFSDALHGYFPAELAAVDMYTFDDEEEEEAKRITLYLDKLMSDVVVDTAADMDAFLQAGHVKSLIGTKPYIIRDDVGKKASFWFERSYGKLRS